MADLRKYVQGRDYYLYGSGISPTATTIKMRSFLLPNSLEPITMAMFGGSLGYMTLDPEQPLLEENISFTGITQNPDGTAVLTGVTRGLRLIDPYTADVNLRQRHIGGAIIRITNSVGFYSDFTNKYNDERIQDGSQWIFPGTTGTARPQLASDADATLDTELITRGERARFEGVIVQDEGTPLATRGTTLNFTGAGVTASGTGSTKTINIPGGGGAGDGKVKVDASDTTADYLDPKLNLHSSDNSVNISKSITNPSGNEVLDYDFVRSVGGSILLQQTFTFSDFALDGFGNRVAFFTDAMPVGSSPVGVKYDFTTAFNAGKTMSVLDDDPAGQVIGTSVPADAIATLVGQTAGSAIFDWSVTPNPAVIIPGVGALSTGVVIVSIIGAGSSGQNAIQFQDEGSNLGTPGTVTAVDFTGSGVTASRVSNKVTVNVEGGSATQQTISQTAHGFSVGDIIRSSGVAGQYTEAQADTAANAEVVGIVTQVVNANSFVITTEGYFTAGVPAQAAGTIMFLSDSVAGGLTATEPTVSPTISKPLVTIITNAAIGYFHNYRGQENQTTPIGAGAFSPQYLLENAFPGGSLIPNSVCSKIGDESVVWTASLSGSALQLNRFEMNSAGMYIWTHGTVATVGGGPTPATGVGIVALGSFVYISYQDAGAAHRVVRFDGADLLNETNMTVSGTNIAASAENRGCFTDGTFLYFYDNTVANGNRNKYSVSGTTITFVSSIDFGTNQLGAYCDGTNVFLLGQTGSDIEKRDLTGTLLTTIDYNFYTVTPDVNSIGGGGDSAIGITYLSSGLFLVHMGVALYNATAVNQYGLYLIPSESF